MTIEKELRAVVPVVPVKEKKSGPPDWLKDAEIADIWEPEPLSGFVVDGPMVDRACVVMYDMGAWHADACSSFRRLVAESTTLRDNAARTAVTVVHIDAGLSASANISRVALKRATDTLHGAAGVRMSFVATFLTTLIDHPTSSQLEAE